MGAKLLSATLGTLFVMIFIDLFVFWYRGFLQKRMPDLRLRRRFQQMVWVLLAILFWGSLRAKGMPETFGLTYFLFVLFIYSIRGLIGAFFERSE